MLALTYDSLDDHDYIQQEAEDSADEFAIPFFLLQQIYFLRKQK